MAIARKMIGMGFCPCRLVNLRGRGSGQGVVDGWVAEADGGRFGGVLGGDAEGGIDYGGGFEFEQPDLVSGDGVAEAGAGGGGGMAHAVRPNAVRPNDGRPNDGGGEDEDEGEED